MKDEARLRDMKLTGRDELHLAMGEFLTECSNLENLMLALMVFCQDKRSLDEIHLEWLDDTFGDRIKVFEKVCNSYSFTKEYREIINLIVKNLRNLLPRRNLIVHGMTHEVAFGGSEARAYRVGLPKGNLDYLNQFSLRAGDVEHSFPVERVRQATDDCRAIASDLAPITNHLAQLCVAATR
jgi:hypothetical protein